MTPRQEESECPECGTENPINSKFCESCGLVIAKKDRQPSKRRKRTTPDRSEGRAIELELAKARGILKSVRLLFIIFGVMSLLPTILLLIAATIEPSVLVIALISTLFTGFLFGAVFFLFAHPLFWTLSVACISTLLSILSWGSVFEVVLFAVIALGLWGSLPLVLNIVRLKKKYPDLITSEKLKIRDKRDVGTSAARVRSTERGSRDRKRAMKSYGIVGGIIAAVIVTVIIVKMWPDSPGPAMAGANTGEPRIPAEEVARIAKLFDPAVEKFRESWGKDAADEVSAMFEKGYGERMWGKVLRSLKRHDYENDFPDIEEFEVFTRRDQLERDVYFDWDSGTIKTRWRFDNHRWEIIKLTLKYI